jgi:adenylate cyclase
VPGAAGRKAVAAAVPAEKCAWLRRGRRAGWGVTRKSLLAFLRQSVVPSAFCFGLALALAQLGWMQNVQNQALDVRTRLRAAHQPSSDARVAVIGIDDESVEQIGRWPWPREWHGRFLALAAEAKAAVVVWDILFTEASAPADDLKLVAGANAARAKGTEVIFGAVTNETPGAAGANPRTPPVRGIEGDVSKIPGDNAVLAPLPELQDRAHFALVNTPPGPDGARRIVPLLGRAGDRVYFSLSVEAVLQFWKAKREDVRVRLGDGIYVTLPDGTRRIPIDETGGYRVNYRFGPDYSELFGFVAMMLGLEEVHVQEKPIPELPVLAGRIVLIGQVATGLTDNGPTPFSGHTPLVLVHANAIENILREDYVREVPTLWMWLGAMAVGVVGLLAFSHRTLVAQAAFAVGLPAVYGLVSVGVWIEYNLVLEVVWPVLGFVGLQVFMISRRLLAEQRAKAQIRGMFGSYVSPALVNRMVDAGEMPQLGGHEAEITAYFSDIQNFSTFSELLPPDRLVELMNEYLTACTDIVQEEGGTLDKYIGDAVVAMFGAPLSLPDHAYRACLATQRVQLRLGELRTSWKESGAQWPEIVTKMQSRIGLNTGSCVIGNMGSRTRFNYTMMGDNVNLAARMESGAKSWGVYSMCTEATKLACEKHGGDRIVFRPLGRIVVKGRKQAVPIFEIAGLKEAAPARLHECIGWFSQGLEKYLARDWAGATACFEQSLQLEANGAGAKPGSGGNPSAVYLDIVANYRQQPPPESWDGVYVMKEK